MPDERPRPSFWETIPGIITAIAALITAVAALITALYTAKLIGYNNTGKVAAKGTQEAIVRAIGAEKSIDATLPASSQVATQPISVTEIKLDIQPLKERHSEDTSFIHDIDITGSPFLGTKNAPVTLVVFSEFQCHFCNKVPPILYKLLRYNINNIKIVFKHLPLNFIHKQSRSAALATIAAHEQGKFWEMHDALFATADNLNQETIKKAAADIDLDMERFQKDWNSSATKQKLKKDMIDATKADVNGTPTLFINGRQVKRRGSNIPQMMIDQELLETK
ncbi:thioredoxin domain-containing protein [Desulfobulbus sp. TB]|nr:thioredoxin domain-containing protein [Desulfobulbus sp. TB]